MNHLAALIAGSISFYQPCPERGGLVSARGGVNSCIAGVDSRLAFDVTMFYSDVEVKPDDRILASVVCPRGRNMPVRKDRWNRR